MDNVGLVIGEVKLGLVENLGWFVCTCSIYAAAV